MELWIKTLLGMVVFLFLLAGLFLFRAKGIFIWKRSLKKEAHHLQKQALECDSSCRHAIGIILSKYEEILCTPPQQNFSIDSLFGYVQSIADCFYAGQQDAYLQITLEQLLAAIENTLERFQLILLRPGFRKIKDLRIRHLVGAHRIADTYRHHPGFGWVRNGMAVFKKFNLLRIWMMGDWISGLIVVLKNFAITRISRYLIADIYMFAGQLAIAAYGAPPNDLEERPINPDDIKQAIDEQDESDFELDARLQLLRNQVVGLKRLLYRPPNMTVLRKALALSAHHIAWRQFPDSRRPLNEATLGAILDRLIHWFNQLQNARTNRIVQYACGWKLQTLVKLHDVQKIPLVKAMQSMRGLSRRQEVTWARWIWRLYRWGRHASALRIGMSASWHLSRNIILAFLYGRLFDMSCKELTIVYAGSNPKNYPPQPTRSTNKGGINANH